MCTTKIKYQNCLWVMSTVFKNKLFDTWEYKKKSLLLYILQFFLSIKMNEERIVNIEFTGFIYLTLVSTLLTKAQWCWQE